MGKFLRDIVSLAPVRRIGTLSDNLRGIKGTANSVKSDSTTLPLTGAPASIPSSAEGVAPMSGAKPPAVGKDPVSGGYTLPDIGTLTSASEDAIVDPSEQVLEHIDLDSWKWPQFFAFSLTRMEELFPVAGIPRGIGPVREFITDERVLRSLPLDRAAWPGIEESWSTVDDVLRNTHTDAWFVSRNGMALAEEYAWPMKPARRHMLFSVSKSIVSTVIGGLVDAGLLGTEDLVISRLPKLADTGYAGATVRDLLDMRSGITFSEEYLVEGSEIRALFEAVDMAPRTADSVNGIKEFLGTLTAERDHGGPFVYRSCETDVLAWICEAVTGKPFPVVASEYVWSKIGAAHSAQVCQDKWGGSIADGALSTTLRDLARFGEMIARGGTTAEGERVLSQEWIDDIFAGGADSAEVFARSLSGRSYPGGMYRSQFWAPTADRNIIMGLGIHGQMLYIDRATQTVGVKLSSDPEPVSLAHQHGTLAMFTSIAEAAVAVETAATVPTAPISTVPPSSF